MRVHYRDAMRDAISEVLETMFFVLPAFVADSEEEGRLSALPCPFETSIEIGNPREVLTMVFRTTERFARIITANFLGTSVPAVVDEEMSDTIKEMANMVAGDFLARQPSETWNLGVPGFRKLPGAAFLDPKAGAGSGVCLCCEREPLWASLVAADR